MAGNEDLGSRSVINIFNRLSRPCCLTHTVASTNSFVVENV